MPSTDSEGSPLDSKKFIAYLISELTWKALCVGVLLWSHKAMETNSVTVAVWGILLLMILVAGFVEAGYILGQAATDQFVKLAAIAVESGSHLTHKGMEIHPGDSNSSDPSQKVDPSEGGSK